ncbi:LPD7 domain-containing protein [Photobacterium damselae]|uniref:LPD7 domain-containing protein n=1 Tax=Photobacterium damselae TaxID=38293 RepID=UPI0010FF3D05|nr:LPD7 domain-containing protein [Photobacterium damselae]TLS73438.1 hypothetical protein FD718_01995 [Photobacterium damselae subsp. damselae]
MLARISAGKAGIIEYLENGIKNGRDFTRDELDHRICIDGNIKLTDTIINAISQKDRDNYYHITLSFKEKDIDNKTIEEVYNSYKEKLLNAYDDGEYNIYAEIHQPKIKSYKDKKTGETIERLPHVHIVIPKKNLLTGNDFNPFGEYRKFEHLHDSIQESCNYKFNLDSPYDSPREMVSKADLISRYKGDNFKGTNFELKSSILDDIHNQDINKWDDFKKVLKNYGEVSETKTNRNHYLSVKLPNAKKNIRLKESCFTQKYIETRLYRDTRPSEREVDKKLGEWINRKSYEVKYVVKDKKNRETYYALSEDKKDEYLRDKINWYNNKYLPRQSKKATVKIPYKMVKQFSDIKTNVSSFKSNLANKENQYERSNARAESRTKHIRKRRWPTNKQPNIERAEFRQIKAFTEKTNSVSRLPKCYVVHGSSGWSNGITSLLSNNELQNVDVKREHQYNALRWIGDRDGERGGLNKSVVSQISDNERQHDLINQELAVFSDIRKNLIPDYLFDNLKKFNIEKESYHCFKSKDGSYRITVGNRNLNVSDFLTKHVHLNWEDARELLLDSYQNQIQKRLDEKEENCIIFKSSKTVKSTYSVYDSIKIFNYLKNQEIYEASNMLALDKLKSLRKEENNEIEPKYKALSFSDIFKHQQELQRQVHTPFKLNDLVASPNAKKGVVDYKNKDTGITEFSDKGDKIQFSRQPSESAVLSGLKMAAEKFGTIKLKGTPEFKESVLEQAAKNDIKVVFEPESLQKQFVELKAQLKDSNEISQSTNQSEIEKSHADKQQQPTEPEQNDIAEPQIDPTIKLEVDKANELFDKWKMDKRYKSTLKEAETIALDVGLKLKEQGIKHNPFSDNEKLSDAFNKGMSEESTQTQRFSYRWNEKDNVFEVKFNDKPISESGITKELVEVIRSQDKFLSNYDVTRIMEGRLSPNEVKDGAEPRPFNVDSQGQKVEDQVNKQSGSLKM